MGVIIDAYWIVSKEKLKEDRYYVRECLIDAWIELLGDDSTQEDDDDDKAEEVISTDNPKLLALFKYIKPHNTEEENIECIQMMDTNEDHVIDRTEWTTKLMDVLRIDFFDKRNPSLLNDGPSKISILRTWSPIALKNFNIFKRIIIAIHTLLFFVVFYRIECDNLIIIHSVQLVLTISLLPLEFFQSGKNQAVEWSNMISYVISTASAILWYWPHLLRECDCNQGSKFEDEFVKQQSCSNEEITKIMIGGALRSINSLFVILRIFIDQSLFSRVSKMITSFFFVLIDLLIVILCIQYLYAALGYELFGSTVVCKSHLGSRSAIQNTRFNSSQCKEDNPVWSDRDYDGYNCGTGFASMSCSALIAFQVFSLISAAINKISRW